MRSTHDLSRLAHFLFRLFIQDIEPRTYAAEAMKVRMDANLR